MLDTTARWQRIDALLDHSAWLWRPRPFLEPRPAWCARLPELADFLLNLSDGDLAELSAQESVLVERLQQAAPELHELHTLCALPQRNRAELRPLAAAFEWDIPGRKWRQIQDFVASVGAARGDWLDWCGGKGHLGRLLAAQSDRSVTTLERDATLCRDGERLANKRRVDQRFVVMDALSPEAAAALEGRHAVALHACGELHRTLLRSVVAQQLPAVDVAPCCYYHGTAATYAPMHGAARLKLSRDDLHAAVTETVTSVAREVRRRDLEMAWKLGFDQLRRTLLGVDHYIPIRLGVGPELRTNFADYCRAVAERERLRLPANVDWSALEAQGWTRQREVMRLALIRAAFRRPLELWLVLDMAIFLEQHGYVVNIGEFCPRTVTPRNLLVSARRVRPQ